MLSPYELSGSRYAPTINPVPVSLFYYKMRSLQQGRNPSDDLLSGVAGIVARHDIRRIRPSLVGIGHHGYEIILHRPDLRQDAVHHHLKVRTREAKISISMIPSNDPIGWLETVTKAPSGR